MAVNVNYGDTCLPALSYKQATALRDRARLRWRAGTANTMMFMMDLRRLQDGGAHLALGYPNFGNFAEHVFKGLSKANAKKLSIQGQVLILLEQEGCIRVSDRRHITKLPGVGVTGLRLLSAIYTKYDFDMMMAAWDIAVANRPGQPVVDTDVRVAMADLGLTLRAVKEEEADSSLSLSEPELDNDVDEDDEHEPPEEAHVGLDHIANVEGELYELRNHLQGKLSKRTATKMAIVLESLLEEFELLEQAVTAYLDEQAQPDPD